MAWQDEKKKRKGIKAIEKKRVAGWREGCSLVTDEEQRTKGLTHTGQGTKWKMNTVETVPFYHESIIGCSNPTLPLSSCSYQREWEKIGRKAETERESSGVVLSPSLQTSYKCSGLSRETWSRDVTRLSTPNPLGKPQQITGTVQSSAKNCPCRRRADKKGLLQPQVTWFMPLEGNQHCQIIQVQSKIVDGKYSHQFQSVDGEVDSTSASPQEVQTSTDKIPSHVQLGIFIGCVVHMA